MNRSKWWLALVLVVSGCNCDPAGGPDASVPLVLGWPVGATLNVAATTASSAELRWPDAVGPVATYRLSWPGGGRDETATTTNLTGLTAGNHLPVEVIAVAADGTQTLPLRAEVAPRAPP